jgi:sensor histidine kinase YesM
MHPILQNWRRFLLWLAAWIPLGAILVLVAHLSARLSLADSAAVMVPAAVVLAFFCLAPFYVCRSLPLRSASAARLVTQHLAAAFILSGAVMLVARLMASFVSSATAARFPAAAPALAVIVLMIYLMAVALHYAALEMESSRRAEVLAREAQLRALKSQVNPHFLFNSLNSISALTAIDAGEAREMCIRLADFLRTSLRLGERVTIPFAEEMALTTMYLEVERVRFGGRLRLTQRMDPACSDCDVPALLIQPLVENAVKHGIAMMAEGGEIAISGECDDQWLRFSISNPFDPEAPPSGRNGLGLRNVRERLEARYGGAARMEIRVEERMYRVALTLPARAAR